MKKTLIVGDDTMIKFDTDLFGLDYLKDLLARMNLGQGNTRPSPRRVSGKKAWKKRKKRPSK